MRLVCRGNLDDREGLRQESRLSIGTEGRTRSLATIGGGGSHANFKKYAAFKNYAAPEPAESLPGQDPSVRLGLGRPHSVCHCPPSLRPGVGTHVLERCGI